MRPKGGLQAHRQITVNPLFVGILLSLFLASCAAPPLGRLPGLGPPFDQFFGVLFVVGIVMLAVWAGHRFLRQGPPKKNEEDCSKRSPAEEIVRLRYAHGAISREEFVRILTDLETPATKNHETPKPS
jgi:hypothetical protein